MKSNWHRLFTTLFLIISFLLINLPHGWAADYGALVRQAREQLQNEQYTEALTTAKKAVTLKPKDYKGHYYAAMAHMSLGQSKEADAEVALALSQAPQNAKPTVEKLVSAIKAMHPNADQSSGEEIFLECSGEQFEGDAKNAEATKYGKPTKVNLILKIGEKPRAEWVKNNNTKKWIIAEWDGKNWFNWCNRKNVFCDVDSDSIDYDRKYELRLDTSIAKTNDTFNINRVSGRFNYRYTTEFVRDDGTIRETTKKLESGVCVPISAPTPVPNKF